MAEQQPVEIQSKEARVAQLNSVLESHNLAPLYTTSDLGDHTRGEIEIDRAGEVYECGDGLNLVEVFATLPNGNELKFVTFFRERESLASQNLLVPFVKDAPGNLDFPDDVAPADETLGKINTQLAQFNLRRLPTIVNCTQEKIVDISRVIDVNNRFFTVVVFDVEDADGNIQEKPLVFNANSASGIDGSVFAVVGRMPQYGKEPRLLIGQQYRPTMGGWVHETFRGFYSPRHGQEGPEIRGLVNVPALKRALDELSDETGLKDVDSVRRVGRFLQDPTTDFVYPDFWMVDVETPEFNEQDLEVSERINLTSLSYGDYFASIPDIKDPFTIAAFTKALLEKGVLRVNKAGVNSPEKMVFSNQFRFQYGKHITEFFRGRSDDLPLQGVGQISVNTGVSRIIPEVYSGSMNWEDYKRAVSASDLRKVRLLHPHEAIEAIERGEINDVLTISAMIKALHSRGFLELANLR